MDEIKNLEISFNKCVVRKEGCWGWTGLLLSKRGKLLFNKKPIQAHRASWMIHFGEIPEGIYVCHTCDNEICTNPDHLFLGTAKDNMQDLLKKNKHPKAKLTTNQVIDIKKMLMNGLRPREISLKYNVHVMTIFDIEYKRTWSLIEPILELKAS